MNGIKRFTMHSFKYVFSLIACCCCLPKKRNDIPFVEMAIQTSILGSYLRLCLNLTSDSVSALLEVYQPRLMGTD